MAKVTDTGIDPTDSITEPTMQQYRADNNPDETTAQFTSTDLVFEVEDGTIYVAGAKDPCVYADVVNIRASFTSHEQLLDEIENCEELKELYDCLFSDAVDTSESEACKIFEAYDLDGVQPWINTLSLERINHEVERWLNSPLPTNYEVPPHMGPMCEAYSYFQQLEDATLEALGIVIVEGEHPGSSYYAAELTIPMEEANKSAALLGIPIFFKVSERCEKSQAPQDSRTR